MVNKQTVCSKKDSPFQSVLLTAVVRITTYTFNTEDKNVLSVGSMTHHQ